MFRLAERNKIALPRNDVEALRSACNFGNLQEFTDLYYAGADVLRTEQDFYDLTRAYLQKCEEQNVVHTEPFFDPQTHTDRGVPFEAALNSISAALADGRELLGISSRLILSFLRHLPEEKPSRPRNRRCPSQCLLRRRPRQLRGRPSAEQVPARVRQGAWRRLAHRCPCRRGGPAGIHLAGASICSRSAVSTMACAPRKIEADRPADRADSTDGLPAVNTKLKVFADMRQHNILDLLEQGVKVTVNSDDPAYFGGYVTENFVALHERA